MESPKLLLQQLVQAQQYAALRKPYLINDILESNTLLDRRRVYQRLQVLSASRLGSGLDHGRIHRLDPVQATYVNV